MELTERERERYQRQMMLSGWGEAGQSRLKEATVGVVGAGGLGSAILTYLVAAGFGRIILVDRDTVELGNLNRQMLHWEKDLGKKKADSALRKLREMNPEVEIQAYARELNRETIGDLLAGTEGLIDGLDNFPDRFLLNEFAVERNLPLFHGAVWGFEGRATTIIPRQGPCFRCIYSGTPAREIPPVVGVSPGLIAMVQVTEAIKYFTGIGRLLIGQLLVYDGESMTFLKAQVERDPGCPVCGG